MPIPVVITIVVVTLVSNLNLFFIAKELIIQLDFYILGVRCQSRLAPNPSFFQLLVSHQGYSSISSKFRFLLLPSLLTILANGTFFAPISSDKHTAITAPTQLSKNNILAVSFFQLLSHSHSELGYWLLKYY